MYSKIIEPGNATLVSGCSFTYIVSFVIIQRCMCHGLNNRVEDHNLTTICDVAVYFGLQNKPTRAKRKDNFISGLI